MEEKHFAVSQKADLLIAEQIRILGRVNRYFAVELTFYDLWPWGIPEKINLLAPGIAYGLWGDTDDTWNCIWLSRLSLPDCDRLFAQILFFSTREIEFDADRFRQAMLDLMRDHREYTGYNILENPTQENNAQWLRKFSILDDRSQLLDCDLIRHIDFL